MAISTGNEKFAREMLDALGLPKNTVWFELRVAVDEAITVRCAYYPELPDGKRGELLSSVRQLQYRDVTAIGDRARTFETASNRNGGAHA
jgi:hypothetical protein